MKAIVLERKNSNQLTSRPKAFVTISTCFTLFFAKNQNVPFSYSEAEFSIVFPEFAYGFQSSPAPKDGRYL